MLDAAKEQLATIAGQKPERAPRAQVDRQLQAARGHARRRGGDAARRAHVRVPRPPDVGRDPADPRLPRAQPALVRRPRQLLDGRARADHLPGDRLRRDRPGARPGRRRSPPRPRPTRRPIALLELRHAVLARGRAGRGRRAARPAEEEQREEERTAQAEAEQAALEQLKEENPEAYEKPSRKTRARRGEDGRRPERERAGVDGKDFTGGPPAARVASTRRATTTAASGAVARARTCASSASAGSACARSRTRA